jgi:beta-lactam-binding protein with PASTA domain
MSLIGFFKSRQFLINLALAIVLTLVILFGTLKFLKVFTHHGTSVTMPDMTGLYFEELEDYAMEGNFEYLVSDSVYMPFKEKGTILNQDPLPGSKVKEGRTVYLTIVKTLPEQVEMPDLVDLTLRQARSILETYGLKLAKLEYKPDIGTDVILEQKYKGKTIDPGTRLNKGSNIVLVISEAANSERVAVPFLIGMKRSKALELLHEHSLNLGAEIYDDEKDTAIVKVYMQSPRASGKKYISRGQAVDVWYKSPDKFDFDSHIKKYQRDSVVSKDNKEIEE